jgi:hypothetical protein
MDYQSYTTRSGNVTITGEYSGGGTIVENVLFGPGFDSYSFSAAWSGLSSITFQADAGIIALDNLEVTAVPIPAAVWLFGSALAGLGWMRRKQTV